MLGINDPYLSNIGKRCVHEVRGPPYSEKRLQVFTLLDVELFITAKNSDKH